MPRDLTAAMATALGAESGTALAYLAELDFDSPVGNDGAQSSTITWTATRPNAGSYVRVDVSLDHGVTWQECTNGGAIPGIVDGEFYGGQTLWVRETFFRDGPTSPELTALHLSIFYDEGVTEWTHDEATYLTLQNADLRGLEVVARAGGTGVVRLANRQAANFPAGHGGLLIPLTQPIYPFALNGSLECWLRVTTVGAQQTILAFEVEALTGTQTNALEAGVHWYVDTDGALVCETATFEIRTEPGVIRATTWHHVVFTWFRGFTPIGETLQAPNREGIARLYVDDALVSQTNAPIEIGRWLGVTPGPVRVGIGVSADPSTRLVGQIDELRIWHVALNPYEVQRYQRQTMTPAEVAQFGSDQAVPAIFFINLLLPWFEGQVDTLAAYYPFDTDAEDQTPRANHAEVGAGVTFELQSQQWFQARPTDVPGAIGVRTHAVSLATQGGRTIRVASTPFPVVWDGKTFLGVAHLGSVGAVEETAGFESRGLQFTLTGIPTSGEYAANVATALGERYLDRPARLWRCAFDANQALVSDPVLLYLGRLDQMPISLGAEATVTVTTENHLRDWQRPRLRLWTDTEQRRRYASDTFFSSLQELGEREIWWPTQLDVQQPLD